jgi:hypothetical protein
MKSRFTLIVMGLAIIALLFGCTPKDRMTRDEVIQQHASRIMAPMKPLCSYTNFKLVGMELTDEITQDEKKMKAAKNLEEKLNQRLSPLLDAWCGKKTMANSNGTLIVKPKLQSLYIVSSGARFWVGGMAGDSNIDMDLILVEEETGNKIGAARIQRTASGMKGGWSVGATDKALPDLIVDIAYQYLAHNYPDPKQPKS